MNGSALRKGAYLALLTALISGVSVYVNSFGVKRVPDPFVFTTAKNLMVALFLASAVVIPLRWREVRALDAPRWGRLFLLGLIGGSVPFLMFFYGLRQATAPSAAFIHKTLFIWVALLAVPLLKERLGPLQLGAFLLLIVGNLVLVNLPARWALSRAELFTFLATLMWAVEAVLARRFITRWGLSAPLSALGRMGFGSLIMLGFLAVTGRLDVFASMTLSQWGWVVLTTLFLVGYVAGYYGALRHAPATLVTSVLVLGSVITSLLHAVFSARTYTPAQVGGFLLIVLASALWLYVAHRLARAGEERVEYAR